MKVARTLIAAVIAASAGAAFAQEATSDNWMHASVSNSRAQVVQELDQARKDGTLNFTLESYDFAGRIASSKSRDQVIGELIESKLSGEYGALNAEAHGFTPIRLPAYAGL
jgi:hypothetical protein